ncbi:MAG: GDP-mannose 4,6-dehydratase, partial [Chroococcidiopsidaceae cyanobacterium CP_BM_RX_35]|nr:GDP-mannose 4,6-dehydratase [Chroococcidiopsidaceae cyanobacterium CP_BM_RX_35]
EQAEDYVIATGETHSVREFLELAFSYVNLDWQEYVVFDQRYLRPSEVELLLGDPSKAKQQLGWAPTVTFAELVALMVEADLKALGCVSPQENGVQEIQDIATVRQELGSLHF